MNNLRKVKDVYTKLNYILSTKQKKLAVVVLFAGIVAALLELLGVAVIVPILDMLLDMDSLQRKWFIRPFVQIFRLDSPSRMIWFIAIGTIGIYLLKNLYFAFFNWISLKYAYKVKRELSIRVLHTYMQQGYIFFVENNTSRLLEGIGNDIEGVYSILNTFFNIATKALTVGCIGVFIILQSKEMAIILIILAIGCFAVIQLIYGKAMQKNGVQKRNLRFENSKTSIEAIQGNKEILVMNKQDFFIDHYEKILSELNQVSVKVDMGTITPAYIIEMICISGVMMAVAVQMGNAESNIRLLTQVSTIAVGAFRMLPALGAITSGINSVSMNTAQLAAAYETLESVKELEKIEREKVVKASQYKNITFQNELLIKNVSYRYPNTEENVLEGINICINKGQSVAFIGPSGAGKTTISDIILSLLKPTAGEILMDGINIEDLGGEWNKIIGYVPQMVYIVDDNIRNNIAFGEEEGTIDDSKIWDALKMARLDDFVMGLPEGLETVVGERGIRFSGGQRQRLAIARALYRNPEILVLDEATAALDNETEAEVMKAIETLQGYKTLIIVAHRLTTVRKCDVIYEVKNRKITRKEKIEEEK